MYACMHACMYACMYACMDVCMYECMHAWNYALHYVRKCRKKWKVAEIENLPKLKGGGWNWNNFKKCLGVPPPKISRDRERVYFLQGPKWPLPNKNRGSSFHPWFHHAYFPLYTSLISCAYIIRIWLVFYGFLTMANGMFLLCPFLCSHSIPINIPILLPPWYPNGEDSNANTWLWISNYADYQSKIIKTFKIIRILNQLYY